MQAHLLVEFFNDVFRTNSVEGFTRLIALLFLLKSRIQKQLLIGIVQCGFCLTDLLSPTTLSIPFIITFGAVTVV